MSSGSEFELDKRVVSETDTSESEASDSSDSSNSESSSDDEVNIFRGVSDFHDIFRNRYLKLPMKASRLLTLRRMQDAKGI